MDWDDTDEKLRRNVVVLSVLIVALLFLKPKLGVSSELFGLSVSSIDPLRAWGFALVGMVYTLLRFTWSKSVADELSKARKGYQVALQLVITDLLERDLQDNLRTGTLRYVKKNFVFSKWYNDNIARLESPTLIPESLKVNHELLPKYRPHRGRYSVAFSNITEQDHLTEAKLNEADYEIGKWKFRYLEFRAWVSTWLAPSLVVEIHTPFLIWLIAFCMAGNHVYLRYLCRYPFPCVV